MIEASPAAYRERTKWFFRPTIFLATAYIIITIIHESSHALTAWFFDISFTMFPYAVSLESEGPLGGLPRPSAVRLALPLAVLIIEEAVPREREA